MWHGLAYSITGDKAGLTQHGKTDGECRFRSPVLVTAADSLPSSDSRPRTSGLSWRLLVGRWPQASQRACAVNAGLRQRILDFLDTSWRARHSRVSWSLDQ